MPSTPTTPFFEEAQRPPLDLDRVRRALDLRVDEWKEGYRVLSPNGRYFVTLSTHYDCNCGDSVWNNQICKHLIAALMYAGDEEALRKGEYWQQRLRASEIAQARARQNQQALMIGRGQGKEIVQEAASDTPGLYGLTEWPKGLLEEIKELPEKRARISKLENKAQTRELSFEELTELGKLRRACDQYPDIEQPGLVVALGVQREKQAVREASQQGLAVIGFSTRAERQQGVFVVPIYPDETGQEAVRGACQALARAMERGRQEWEQGGGEPPTNVKQPSKTLFAPSARGIV